MTPGHILAVKKWPGGQFSTLKMTGRVIFQWGQFSTLQRQIRNITTLERTVYDMEIEIISFVVNENVKLTIPPNWQK